MDQPTVLLTGVTGFIGSHTTVQLLEKGYRVTGTLRNKQRAEAIRQVIASATDKVDQLSFIEADLRDKAVWREAVTGVDYVQHIASPLPTVLPKNPDDLILPAKEGTLHVLEAAVRAGVRRVVITSSSAAIGHGKTKVREFTEADWSDETNLQDHTAYTRSKTVAEKAAWAFMEQQNGPTQLAVVNPVVVLGPVLEKDFSASVELIKTLLEGKMPAVPKIGMALVDVRSVADLHIKAMEIPEAAGHRFIAANQFYWIKETAAVLKKAYPDRRIPSREIPDFVFRFLSTFEPKLKAIAMDLKAKRAYRHQKAKDMLGWEPLSDEQSILDTAESLIRLGVV